MGNRIGSSEKKRRKQMKIREGANNEQYQNVKFWNGLLRKKKKNLINSRAIILEQVQILFRGVLGLFEVLDEVILDLELFDMPQSVVRTLSEFAVNIPNDEVSFTSLHVLVKLAIYDPKHEDLGIIGRRLFPTIVQALASSDLYVDVDLKHSPSASSNLLVNCFFVFGLHHMKFQEMVDPILNLRQRSILAADNKPFMIASENFLTACRYASGRKLDKDTHAEACFGLTNFWWRMSKPAGLSWEFECALNRIVLKNKPIHNRFVWYVLDLHMSKSYRKRALAMVNDDMNKGRTFKTIKEIRREMRIKARQKKKELKEDKKKL